MSVRTGLEFLLICAWITLIAAAGARLIRWHYRRPARPEATCGHHGDDGLSICHQCGQVGPHDQFTTYQQAEPVGMLRWMDVTYYRCKGGCWPWPR